MQVTFFVEYVCSGDEVILWLFSSPFFHTINFLLIIVALHCIKFSYILGTLEMLEYIVPEKEQGS